MSQAGNAAARQVVVADDDPELRRILVELFRRDGYAVAEMRDGKELVDYIGAKLLPAAPRITRTLLLSDVQMPRYSGLEALAILRSSDWSTPVVLMTAAPDAALHRRARELGAALLDKPIDVVELRALVLKLLEDDQDSRETSPTCS